MKTTPLCNCAKTALTAIYWCRFLVETISVNCSLSQPTKHSYRAEQPLKNFKSLTPLTVKSCVPVSCGLFFWWQSIDWLIFNILQGLVTKCVRSTGECSLFRTDLAPKRFSASKNLLGWVRFFWRARRPARSCTFPGPRYIPRKRRYSSLNL